MAESNNSGSLPFGNNGDCSSAELNALRQQAHWLSHMLAVMPNGMIVLDAKGCVKVVNQVAIDLLGEPLEGQLWRDVISRAFRPQSDDGHEVSLHNGKKVKVSLSSLHPQPGQLIVLTDLTQTRELQSRVSHMKRLSSLGKMVASLAHQIRTPLSAAMLYAENLLSEKLTDEQQQGFTAKLTARLGELEHQVNDMLLFARSGDAPICEPLDMVVVVKQALMACEGKAQQHQCSITFDCEQSSVLTHGNATALSGAVQNLINNALQASKRQQTVELKLSSLQQQIQLQVIDCGYGIEPQHLSTLFQPFVTFRSQGTGLGLAVVDSVAKAHQGKITVQSTIGQGSCFTLTLPQTVSLEASQDNPAQHSNSDSMSDNSLGNMSNNTPNMREAS